MSIVKLNNLNKMKKLEKLNSSKFDEFKADEFSNIASVVGGVEGNTRGGYDWRDKCTKRRCDAATTVCEDVQGAAYDPGDGSRDLDPFSDWTADDPDSPLNGSPYVTTGMEVPLDENTVLGWWG